MHINADLYYNKEDIITTIDRLVKLFEDIEDLKVNTDAIQEAIDILYDVVESAEE